MIISLLRIFAIICVAFVCGKLVSRVRLPAILGWLIAGIVFGPYLAGVVTQDIMNSLWYEILIKFFECFAGVMIGREILFQKIASSGKQMKSSLLSLQNLRLSGQAKSERRRVPPAKLSLAQTKSVCTCGAQNALRVVTSAGMLTP